VLVEEVRLQLILESCEGLSRTRGYMSMANVWTCM